MSETITYAMRWEHDRRGHRLCVSGQRANALRLNDDEGLTIVIVIARSL
jgi:hypothetical protein